MEPAVAGGTGTSEMLSAVKGSTVSSGTPGHPTQAPSRAARIGSRAVTRPPGAVTQVGPVGPSTRSTGSRLATTTRSKVGGVVLIVQLPTQCV